MAKKQKESIEQEQPHEDGEQTTAGPEESGRAKRTRGKRGETKADKVREVIMALGGPDAVTDNQQVINKVREKYGQEVTTGEVSIQKAKLRKTGKKPSREGGSYPSKGFTADDVITLKELADRLGVEEVKKVLDAFS